MSVSAHSGLRLKPSPARCALILLAFTGSLIGASGPHGSVELVPERTSVQPGQSLSLGLHFQLEKDWHIYWINPGDSGEPPSVKWNLPTGFQANPLEWPVPRRIPDHSLIDYGYQDEVLLPVEIKAPPHLVTGRQVALNARVNWLVCREICIPAHADLSLDLPIGKGTPSSFEALFIKTRNKLPKPAPETWRMTAKLDGRNFVLNAQTGKPERDAAFFPFEPGQLENASPQKVESSSQGFRLELPKSDQLLKPPSFLAGVLVLASGQGYAVKAPVVTVDSKRTH